MWTVLKGTRRHSYSPTSKGGRYAVVLWTSSCCHHQLNVWMEERRGDLRWRPIAEWGRKRKRRGMDWGWNHSTNMPTTISAIYSSLGSCSTTTNMTVRTSTSSQAADQSRCGQQHHPEKKKQEWMEPVRQSEGAVDFLVVMETRVLDPRKHSGEGTPLLLFSQMSRWCHARIWYLRVDGVWRRKKTKRERKRDTYIEWMRERGFWKLEASLAQEWGHPWGNIASQWERVCLNFNVLWHLHNIHNI